MKSRARRSQSAAHDTALGFAREATCHKLRRYIDDTLAESRSVFAGRDKGDYFGNVYFGDDESAAVQRTPFARVIACVSVT